VNRDAANRFGIALRYASPPPGQGSTLGDWREYAERVVSEASVRGLTMSVALSDPEDEDACAQEDAAEAEADARRMLGEE
jgi:hypothetical protein